MCANPIVTHSQGQCTDTLVRWPGPQGSAPVQPGPCSQSDARELHLKVKPHGFRQGGSHKEKAGSCAGGFPDGGHLLHEICRCTWVQETTK